MRRRAFALIVAALAAGCTVGPDYEKPELKLPPGWTEQRIDAANTQVARHLKDWWTEFHDPVLTQLVDDVIAGNLQLQMARQRLVEARAERTVAGAAEYPQIDAGAQAADAASSTTLQWPPGNGDYRTYAFGFDASWELDIFGGTKRAEQAADAGVGASIEDRRAILVTLLAELATDYATLRATQLRTVIAMRNVDTASHAVDLTTTEFARGLTTSLAVAQARAQMEAVRAVLPTLRAQSARLTHAIAVLTGRFPGELEAQLSVPKPIVPVPPALPLSLPSEVVANRPDIQRAERRFAAATARVGVAVSQLYPHFSIPLMLMPTTSYLHEAFSAASLVWSVGLSASENLYDGGQRTARIDEARAAAEIERISYRQTVLTAFREVEDALINFQTETQRRASLQAAAADSQAAFDRAQRLYTAGLTDFLNVLSTERTLYAAQDQVALSDLARVQQVITLYQALGGGWQAVTFGDEIKPPSPDREDQARCASHRPWYDLIAILHPAAVCFHDAQAR
jgi:NodT family efflux transporter outer membrane factor (OMF) lipoprotein